MQVNHDFLVDGNLHNRAIIDVRDGGVPGTILSVGNDYASDDGRMYLDTVLDGFSPGVSDRLHVQGDTSGITELSINNIGGAGAATPSGDDQGILVVQVDGDSAGDFVLATPVIAGDYRYDLHKGANGNWYLQSGIATVIGGRVCFDVNRDGVCDTGEDAVAEGVMVELLDVSGKVIQSVKIDASGRYKFYLEGNSRYRLHFVLSEALVREGYTFPGIGLIDDHGYSDWVVPEKGAESLVWNAGIACPCGAVETDTGNTMVPLTMCLLFMLLASTGCLSVRRAEVGRR
jgi:hypothetical protein